MNKLNRLFAILFAMLGVNFAAKAYTTADLTAAGWTKVESITDVQNYYYMFVDAKSSNYAMAHVPENGRGCYKTLANPAENMGFSWILEENGDAYNLKNAYSNAYFNSGPNGWNNSLGVNNDNANYTFTLSDGKYSIKSVVAGGLLGPWNNDGAVANDGENVAANKSSEQAPGFYLYSIPRASYIASCTNALATATKANPVDATFLIFNSDFSLKNQFGWTLSGSSGNRQYGNETMEAWNNSSFEISRKLSYLPNGVYTVTADVISGPDTPLNAYLYAIGASEVTSEKVSAVASANNYGTMSNEVKGKTLTAANVLVTDGTLTLGVRDPQGWIVIDNFTLSYMGVDLTALRNALNEKITEAEAIDNSKLTEGFVSTLSAAVETAKNAEDTKEDLETQTANLVAMIAQAQDIQQLYAKFNTLVGVCETYAAESYSNVATVDVRTTFTTAISTAKTNANAAIDIAALNTVYNRLEAARQEFVDVAYPTAGNSFDMTFKILNAEVVSKDSWETNAGLANNVEYTGAPDKYALDRWDASTMSVYANQTINDLPDGVYTLTAMARTNRENMNYVYAASNDVEYKTVVVGGGSTGNPWGLVTVSNILVSKGSSMTLGFKGENNNTWFSVDNFKLSRAYDASVAQNAVKELTSEAVSLTNKLMNKDVKKALEEAISRADGTSGNPFELGNMASALNIAVTDAKASIAAYEAIPAYITKANSIDASIAVDYQTAYDNRTLSKSAETVFQELEVATYKFVDENYAYPVALSDTWGTSGTENTKAADFNGEHWSDDKARKYKNQFDNWDSNNYQGFPANSWKINFEQEVTLPAGEYVFKVAGRKSADATLELVVTKGETILGTVNDFPSGNEGLGINKAGVTSFDVNGDTSFAKDGKGYGWQWRYVKFELNEETVVKVAIHAETSKQYNWVSFGDYTLQMDEKTYRKVTLNQTITNASSMGKVNVGEGVFETPASALTTLKGAIATAQAMYDNASATTVQLTDANTALLAAIDTYKKQLNAPKEGARYYMAVATEGHSKKGRLIMLNLGTSGENNKTGYTLGATTDSLNYRLKAFSFVQVEENLYNICIDSADTKVYLTYGAKNGSAAGHMNWQIQATTVEANKGEFRIETSPTVKGAFRIVNTITNTNVDCQEGGSLYTDDPQSKEDFALVDASTFSTTINIEDDTKLATCVLVFDAELPTGVKAYTAGTLANNVLTLVEATKLEAYTPYVLYAENGYYGKIVGEVDMADYKFVVECGALAGAVETQVITTGYALQNQPEKEGVAFYSVDTKNSQKVTIPAGKCWLNVVKDSTPAATTRSISLRFPGNETTGMKAMEIPVLIENGEIYTIDGKRVENMQSGQIYIVGGQKIIKK